jgi:hypothetical protein
MSGVDQVSSPSPVCSKSFKSLHGSKSVTVDEEEANTSEISITTYDPTQYRNTKLSFDTKFQSANLKAEAISEINECIKEWYENRSLSKRVRVCVVDSIFSEQLPMAAICEYNNVPSGAIKGETVFDT